jgi:ERCC4-type nuclease
VAPAAAEINPYPISAYPASLSIAATQPAGKTAQKLAELAIAVVPIAEDEGDIERYVLSERVAVDRRTGSGLLRGIQDKTLFTSAIYLREHFEVPILIVEGAVDYAYTSFHPQAVRGALTSMMLEYGLNLLSTQDLDDTVAVIAMLARQEQSGIPDISLIPKRKVAGLPDLQRRVIEMLPGCGRVMARDLLQHFGSVKRIVDATAAELCGVRGVGEKKAAEIHQVLNAEYEAIDTERNLEDAIEADPSLLFPGPVALLARQHHIYSEGDERRIIDLVFLEETEGVLILVELKHGELRPEHEAQLRRYLDNAHRSPLLRAHLEQGAQVRGVLATATPCDYVSSSPDITPRVISELQVIEVLKTLRRNRLVEQ